MKKRMFNGLRHFGILVAAMLALSGCSKNTSGDSASSSAAKSQEISQNEVSKSGNPSFSDGAMDEATKDWKTYTVGTTADYPPFTFLDSESNVVGFDADILKEIGKRRKFKVNFVSTIWNGVFESLQQGKIDIVAMALVISPSLTKVASFSDTYLRSGRGILVANESIRSFEDLPGHVVVTQEKTTNIPILEQLFGDKINIVPVKTNYMEVQYLIKGDADAAYDDAHALQYHYRKVVDADYRFIPDNSYKPDNFVFAVKIGNDDLKNELNMGLREIRQDGTYRQIYEKWFGTNVDEFGYTKKP